MFVPKTIKLPAISRRNWLCAAGAAVFSAAALFNLKRVFAQAQVTQVPILSAANLGALLIRDRALLAEFADDPVRFLHARFGLTPANSAFLAHFAPQDLDSARQAAQLALGIDRPLVFQPATSWPDATRRIAVAAPAASRAAVLREPVTIFFPANECAQANQEAEMATQLAAELRASGISMSAEDLQNLAASIGADGAAGVAVALSIAAGLTGGASVGAAVQQTSQGINSSLNVVKFLKFKLRLPTKTR